MHKETQASRGKKIALTGALTLLACATLGIASAWAPDLPVATLEARWARSPSRFVTVDRMRVHLRDEGVRDDPHPILLLHGTSASLHTWDGWVKALRGHHRVIRVDLPGFGLTGPTPDGDYRIAIYTRFIVSLLDALQVERATLVGNSFGGYLAWKTAVDHPERVAKLILIDASGYAYQAKSVPVGFRLARIPALAPFTTKLLTRGLIASSLRNVYGDPSKVTPELIERYYEITLREGNRRAVIERFAQNPNGQFEAEVSHVHQPTLILWGAKDKLIPVSNGLRFAREIAHAQFKVFERLGHVPHEEEPASTVAFAEAFLARP